MAFGKHTDPLVGANTQFKPGESGNPNGAPKGYKHLSTHIQEMLNDPEFSMLLPDLRDGFKEHKGAPIKAIVRVATIRAAQGEKESREWLAKYGYGQKLQLSNDPENPITPTNPEIVDKWTEYLKSQTRE
jgi:hypothetical protein